MFKDPIVAEVRNARDDYAKKFDYDLDAICRALREKQSSGGATVVSFPPKLIKQSISTKLL